MERITRGIKKDWAELWDKKTGRLYRIVYSPFTREHDKVCEGFILPEYYKDIKIIWTT